MKMMIRIPRRVILAGAAVVGAGISLYLSRNKGPGPKAEEASEDEKKADAPKAEAGEEKATAATDDASGFDEKTPPGGHQQAAQDEKGKEADPADEGPALARAFNLFLKGERWLDEDTWKDLWSDSNVKDPAAWIREDGMAVLRQMRRDHGEDSSKATGIRRRFIVVCRYADLAVEDGKSLWDLAEA